MKVDVTSKYSKYVGQVINAANKEADINSNSNKYIPIEKLKQNFGKVVFFHVETIQTDQNIRSNIDTESEDFKKLLESIREHGVLQNPVVELRENDQTIWGYDLICVAGHRRLLAASVLGIERVNCSLHKFSNASQRTGIALAENLNREGLYSLDIADGYAKLLNEGWTEQKISEHFERNIRTIRRYLNIAQLPEELKLLIRENKTKFPPSLIMGNFALRSFKTEESIQKLKNEILEIINPNSPDQRKQLKSNPVERKLEKYFTEKNEILSDDNKKAIRDALVYLGYL